MTTSPTNTTGNCSCDSWYVDTDGKVKCDRCGQVKSQETQAEGSNTPQGVTIIWLRNGANFYVQEDYDWVRGRWLIRRTGIEELNECDRTGTFCGKVTLDLEQISNVHNVLPTPKP